MVLKDVRIPIPSCVYELPVKLTTSKSEDFIDVTTFKTFWYFHCGVWQVLHMSYIWNYSEFIGYPLQPVLGSYFMKVKYYILLVTSQRSDKLKLHTYIRILLKQKSNFIILLLISKVIT